VQRPHAAAPAGAFVLPLIDLRDLPEPVRRAETERLIVADGRRLFDLARGPLLRASLARTADREHVVIQTEHHLVHDGWAEEVLLGDLLELYAACTERRPPRLPELSIQFADYASWQRRWLRGEALERQLAWWRDHLAGAPPLLELPADRTRPPVQSGRGGAHEVVLAAPLVAGLAALARRQGVTLFMSALASFAVLLHRLSAQPDLVVGTGVANRRRREMEGMLGMVINNLALRIDLAGAPPFRDLLRRVRETCLGAYAHQDVPFERVVETLHPERSLSHTPIFQVAFAFHDAPRPVVDLPGLRIRPGELHNRSAKFDLTLIAAPAGGPPDAPDAAGAAGGALAIHLEYGTDLFDAPTVRRWLTGWQALIAGLTAAPDARPWDLPWLRPEEAHQLLVEWSRGAAVAPRGAPAQALFHSWAGRAPEATAVTAGDLCLTYGRLRREAGRLARRLRRLGVGPEVVVAIGLERSPAAIVAILAALEAGGAYLPIDLSYPRERIAFMLEDSGARLLLTRHGLLEDLPPGAVRRVCAEVPEPAGDEEAPLPATPPEHLAYVIYTSGSTGRPKGVMMPHRGLSHLVRGQTEVVGFGPGTRVLQFSSLGFDASVWEIMLALSSGATLVLGGNDELMPGPGLLRLLARQAVGAALLPPSALSLLPPEPLPALRTLVVGGEACPPELPARWAAGRRLINAYGPTEGAVWATVARLPGGDGPRRPGSAAGPRRPAGADRRGRGAVAERRRPRPRLPATPGDDRRELRPGRLRHGAW
jgi:non-ribosomal peptide synthetase component F